MTEGASQIALARQQKVRWLKFFLAISSSLIKFPKANLCTLILLFLGGGADGTLQKEILLECHPFHFYFLRMPKDTKASLECGLMLCLTPPKPPAHSPPPASLVLFPVAQFWHVLGQTPPKTQLSCPAQNSQKRLKNVGLTAVIALNNLHGMLC